MDSNTGSIIGMLFIPAAIMIILGLLMYQSAKKKTAACTATAEGKVDSYKTKNGILTPIVRFSVSGSRFYADLRDDGATKTDYPIKKAVTVHYNPKKPQSCYAGDQAYVSSAGLILAAAGGAFAFIAVVMLLTI
ncbi:MAG: DUF3592 domain-containing protein [Lachnospiraceae bacterium]|jgi:hypothetical protein